MRYFSTKIWIGFILSGWLIIFAGSFWDANTSEQSVTIPRPKLYVSNQLVIQFKSSFKLPASPMKTASGNAKLDSLNSYYPLRDIVPLLAAGKSVSSPNHKASLAQIYLFKFGQGSSLSKLKKSYETLDIVELVEFNYFYFGDHSTSSSASALLQSQMVAALPYLNCRNGVILALIDTGIDWQNEYLKRTAWQNRQEKPDGKDNDANGLVDDLWGWNFVDPELLNQDDSGWDSRPIDLSGHGTRIAEAINQLINYPSSNNENNTKNKLMILKAGSLKPDGTVVFTAFAAAKAIIYAADHGARIVNLSWSSDNMSLALEQAINYAAKKGCVIIAAAGDQNSNQPHYPAAFEPVWAVTATGDDDKKLESSNCGHWIDLAAPGLPLITISAADSNQVTPSATAIAAANVSGLAGLLLSCHDIVDSDSLKRRMLWSSDDIYPDNARNVGDLGAGRINVLRAINSQHRPNIVIQNLSYHLNSDALTPFPVEMASVTINIKNLSSSAQNVHIELTTDDPYLSVASSEIFLAELNFNQEFTNEIEPLTIIVAKDYPPGHKANLMLTVTTANGFSVQRSFAFMNRAILPKNLAIIDRYPVLLSWAGDPEFIGYHIYRNSGEGRPYHRLNSRPLLQSTFSDETVQPGFRYSYYVTGIDSTGWESPASAAVSIVIKEAPAFLFYPAQDTMIANRAAIRFSALPLFDDGDQLTYQWRVNGKSLFDDSNHWSSDAYVFQHENYDTVSVTIANFESDTTISHQWVLGLTKSVQKLKIRSVVPDSDTTLSRGDSLKLQLNLQPGNHDSLTFRWQVNGKIVEDEADSLFVLLTDSLLEGKNFVRATATSQDTTLSYSWNVVILPARSAWQPFFFFPRADTMISVRDTVLFFVKSNSSASPSFSCQWSVNRILDTTAVDSFYQFFKVKKSFDPDTLVVHVIASDSSIYHRWIIHYLPNPNQTPQIIDCFPPTDSALVKADSLLFRIHCQDRDGDTLQFFWSLNGWIDTTAHDSAYWYCIWDLSMTNDTLTVVVADADTSVSLHWILRSQDFVPPPASTNPIGWLPESDSLLAQGDSLIFLVRTSSDSCRFQWLINNQIDSTAHDSVFVFQFAPGSMDIDTIQVDVIDSDRLFSHRWYVHYFNRKPGRGPLRLKFEPEQNVITSAADSLKFSVQILEGDLAELAFQWSVNNHQDTAATDTIFYYPVPYAYLESDTVQLTIWRSDTAITHQWIVDFRQQQTLPPPHLIFPIKGNRITEDDKLIWENDSSLMKIAAVGNWRYVVQLSRDSTFSKIVSSDTCTTTSLRISALSRFDLVAIGKPLYWRVKIFSDHAQNFAIAKCELPFYYYPQFAQLQNFYGQQNTDGTIELFWITVYEANCAGFNVYRSEAANDRYEKINGALITGKTNYSFQDQSARSGKSYFYKLEDVSLNGKKKLHNAISVSTHKPEKFSLWQNYPNPFNTQTSIRYELPTASNVKIIVCNVLGRKVKTLVDETKEAGFYTVYWDGVDDQGENVVSGIYFYTMLTLTDKLTRKMIVVR